MPTDYKTYVEEIKASGFAHSDVISEDRKKDLFIPTRELEELLESSLKGMSLKGMALRTRSKFLNEKICIAMGYPIPKSFGRTKPRFVGQHFDKYIQKANNLQIWNDEIDSARRYVLIRVDTDDVIQKVKVVTGDVIAKLDTTGTLTQKHQARMTVGKKQLELCVKADTRLLKRLFDKNKRVIVVSGDPASYPEVDSLLPISEIFARVSNLVGKRFEDPGVMQDRNRGGELHQLVCRELGYKGFRDDGQFPDVRNQLLEVKLQTSPTIDLGLVNPDSKSELDTPEMDGVKPRHCDVRYLVVAGDTDGKQVTVTNVILTNGENFFSRFPKFQGKGINKKLQIPLPSGFFGE